MSENENFPKRLKISENFPAIQPGSQVRLVNLPAHPGLEGVVAKVLSFEDDNFVEVEIRKTKIVKRVCFAEKNLRELIHRSNEIKSDQYWSDVLWNYTD